MHLDMASAHCCHASPRPCTDTPAFSKQWKNKANPVLAEQPARAYNAKKGHRHVQQQA